MSIEYIEGVSVKDYEKLRASAGWPRLAEEQHETGLRNSSFVIGAYDNGICVGMGRILWDGGYVSYIADVLVLPEYQGQGIGKNIVISCEEFVKSQVKPDWKMLFVGIAAPGKDDFYSKLGFSIRPNENAGSGFNKWFGLEDE